MENWYTRQEASEILGVSTNTIYHYSKQGKIKKIPDPHRLYRVARYEKAGVDRLAEEMKRQPADMLTTSEIAKQLGLSVQHIYKYIKDGTIEAKKVPKGDERIQYYITYDAAQKAKEELRPLLTKIRRSEYYNFSLDIALFQHFHSTKISTARVSKNEKQQWGFYLPITQKWISYNEGIKTYELKPLYSIHEPFIQGSGYVRLSFSKDEDIFFPFLDYLYETWGIENVRVRNKKDEALIAIKTGAKPFEIQSFSIDELLPFITEGSIKLQENFLITESKYRKTSLELPISMLATIKKLAKEERINTSEWVEKALEQFIKNK